MGKFRTVVAYKNHFEDFLSTQPIKVQNKIYKIIELIETLGIVPSRYIKKIEGTDKLYETRFSLGRGIWRVFCFFDEGCLVILLNGFQKKSQKTPKREIEKAKRLMNEYFQEKHKI
ncbi:MAG: type II toxin-antitoxin system RelE/ParE family toxin [Bacteroidales bacterium]|nr:type II toxin-antitoxin system RelE/ParE family toxin [Bacteroidales bacterium]